MRLIENQFQLAQRVRAAFQGHALEVFGEGGAAVVFADDFARRFQAQEVFVRGDADGVRFGGRAGDGPYFPADLFPSRAVGALSVAGPCQGVGDFMQNRVPDFMGGFQIGADEVDGDSDAFFQQAAHSQPSPGTVPAELPVRKAKFIHFQPGVSLNVPEAVAVSELVVPDGHAAERNIAWNAGEKNTEKGIMTELPRRS